MTFCRCGYFATVAKTMEITCPLCRRAMVARTKDEIGQLSWAALHSAEDPNPKWYKTWLETIPKFDCECRSHWNRLTAKHPPKFESKEAFREWAILMHNLVNVRLGKPIWRGGTDDAASQGYAIIQAAEKSQ